jgi:cytochrome c554/c'-like protein
MSRIASAFSRRLRKVNRLALSRLSACVAVGVSLLSNSTALHAASLQTDKFVGAVGCKSSSCHGGAGEKRSQYLTWVQQDFHVKSYAILINARSARIAETLSLPAAQSSNRCTVCHSPFQSVAPARLAPTAQPDEGVSCESCHNAAESWLRGHTRTDWTYAMRISAGMRDLRSFYVRANTCVACHQNIDSDIIKAGHPELTFELDGQSVAEPKHWREDDPASGPRAWLVGQAVALREMSWMLANQDTTDADAAARWSALGWLLAKATADQTRLPVIDLLNDNSSHATFTSAQNQADFLARQAAAIAWDNHRTDALLQTLMETESEFVSPAVSSELLRRRATRLVLALDRLSRALSTTPGGDLTALSEDVRAIPFQPAKFAADLATFRATIKRAP